MELTNNCFGEISSNELLIIDGGSIAGAAAGAVIGAGLKLTWDAIMSD